MVACSDVFGVYNFGTAYCFCKKQRGRAFCVCSILNREILWRKLILYGILITGVISDVLTAGLIKTGKNYLNLQKKRS